MKIALRLVLIMSLLLAACGSVGEQVAATVDGTEITVDDVLQVYPAGEDEDVISTDRFRTNLSNVIIGRVIIQAAEEQFGISATEDQVEEQYQGFVSQLESGDPEGNYDAALEANGITDLRVRQAAEEQVVADALRERLTEDAPAVDEADVETELETNADFYRQVCVSHILVETEEEATAVKERLEAGEDFAEVAAEVSTDTASGQAGGSLGCSSVAENAQRYVPEFAQGIEDAEVGVVSDPVETEFGWHLILVESIDDDEAVRDTISTSLASTSAQQYFQDWIFDALSSSDITVNEDFGTWVDEPQPGIVAPDSATDDSAPTEETTATTVGETSTTAAG